MLSDNVCKLTGLVHLKLTFCPFECKKKIRWNIIFQSLPLYELISLKINIVNSDITDIA